MHRASHFAILAAWPKVYNMPKKPAASAAHRRGRLIGICCGGPRVAPRRSSSTCWFTPTGCGSARWACGCRCADLVAAVVGAAAGAIFFAIFYANVEIARRLSPRHHAFEGIDVVEYVNERTVQGLRRGGLIVSALIAILVGVGMSGNWLLFQSALNGVSFGVRDPVFHHDIGFYVFTLPAWQAIYGLVMGALIGGLVVAVIIHGAMGGLIQPQHPLPRGARRKPRPAGHDRPVCRGALGGSAGPLVAYLADSGKLSDKDLKTLRAIAQKIGQSEPK